mgnify:CR=1 FL=1
MNKQKFIERNCLVCYFPKKMIKKLTKTKKNFNKSLLKIIVCPLSKKPLCWDSKKNELISKESGLAYPIIDGIPLLIKEKARKL